MSFIDKFQDFIRNNYLLLVISFVLGIIMWFVADEKLTDEQEIVGIPVTFNLPDNVIITQINGVETQEYRINVKVDGPRKVISDLKPKAFEITIDVPPVNQKLDRQAYSFTITRDDVKLPPALNDVRVVQITKNANVDVTLEITREIVLKVEPTIEWGDLVEFIPYKTIEYKPRSVLVRMSARRYREDPISIVRTMPIEVTAKEEMIRKKTLFFTTRAKLNIDERKYTLVNKSDNDIEVTILSEVPKKLKRTVTINLTGMDPDKTYKVRPREIELDVTMPYDVWRRWDKTKSLLSAIIDLKNDAPMITGGKVDGKWTSIGQFRPQIRVSPEYPGIIVDELPLTITDNLPEVYSMPRQKPRDERPFPEPVPISILVGPEVDMPYTMKLEHDSIRVRVAGSPEALDRILKKAEPNAIKIYAMADEAVELVGRDFEKVLGKERTLQVPLRYSVPKYPDVILRTENGDDFSTARIAITYTHIPKKESKPVEKIRKTVSLNVKVVGGNGLSVQLEPRNVEVKIEWLKSDNPVIQKLANDQLVVGYIDLTAPPLNRDGFPPDADAKSGNYSLKIGALRPEVRVQYPLADMIVRVTASEATIPLVSRPWKRPVPVEPIFDRPDAYTVAVSPEQFRIRIKGNENDVAAAMENDATPVRLLVPLRAASFGEIPPTGVSRRVPVLIVPLRKDITAVDESGETMTVTVTVSPKPKPIPKTESYNMDIVIQPVLAGTTFAGGTLTLQRNTVSIIVTGPHAIMKSFKDDLKKGQAVAPVVLLVLPSDTLSTQSRTGTGALTPVFHYPGLTVDIPRENATVNWTFTPAMRAVKPDDVKPDKNDITEPGAEKPESKGAGAPVKVPTGNVPGDTPKAHPTAPEDKQPTPPENPKTVPPHSDDKGDKTGMMEPKSNKGSSVTPTTIEPDAVPAAESTPTGEKPPAK